MIACRRQKNYPILLLVIILVSLYYFSAHANLDYKIITRIHINGNNKTKDKIIYRELLFKEGDTLAADKIENILAQTKSNLVNTQLFNHVNLVLLPIDSVYTDVLINLKERWYFWPVPIFQFADPNFNTWWQSKSIARTNIGVVLLKQNFRGLNEDIGAQVQLGYSKAYAFIYNIPYITQKQTLGMGIIAEYRQNHEITIATENNKRVFYTGESGDSRTIFSSGLRLNYRKKVFGKHHLEIKYNSIHIKDTITRLTDDYLSNNQTRMNYIGLHYFFRYDKRDNKGYPLKGYFLQTDYHQNGLGFNFENNLSISYFIAAFKKYFDLGKGFYFASQLKGKYTPSKRIPYYLQEGLGYVNFVRGYEYYILDGQHFALLKTNLKYSLIKPREKDVNWLQNTNFSIFHYAFYLNIYFDAGYVWDKYYADKNSLNNQLIGGMGLGIDFVSFYDKVIRFEYSINKDLKHGFFLHFIQPI
jgi:outer membrane protein assembly factor BamA